MVKDGHPLSRFLQDARKDASYPREFQPGWPREVGKYVANTGTGCLCSFARYLGHDEVHAPGGGQE